MIKSVKFILAGILFGIIMSKSEAISWYRIQEMFRFQSFHMFGIMGTALLTGIIAVWLMKKMKARDIEGKPVSFTDKRKNMASVFNWRYNFWVRLGTYRRLSGASVCTARTRLPGYDSCNNWLTIGNVCLRIIEKPFTALIYAFSSQIEAMLTMV
ncbi:hypothetical protein [Pedobacter steynii]